MQSRTDLLTAVQVAELLGVDRFQVIRLHHRGQLVAKMRAPGKCGALFFARRDVEKVLRAREAA